MNPDSPTSQEIAKLALKLPKMEFGGVFPDEPCLLISMIKPPERCKMHVWYRPETPTEPRKVFVWSEEKNDWIEDDSVTLTL